VCVSIERIVNSFITKAVPFSIFSLFPDC